MALFNFIKGKNDVKPDVEVVPIDARAASIERRVKAFNGMIGWGVNGLNSFFSGSNSSKRYYSHATFGYYALQARSRKLYLDSPIAKSAINRVIESTVNRGITLESAPMFSLIGNDDLEKQKAWRQKTEALWKLWSNSLEADVTGAQTFNQMQRAVFQGLLRDGEFFLHLKYSRSKDLVNPLQFQLIDPMRVCTPLKPEGVKPGNGLFDGIEVDNNGREVAYFITDSMTNKSVRIPKFGDKSGRVFMLHGYIPEYAGQVRGFPFLSGVITELKKLTDYGIAEIQAAVINASIAGLVKPSEKHNSSRPLGGVVKKEDRTSLADDELINAPPFTGLFTEPGIFIQNLKAGEDIQSFDTKRPNVNYGIFVDAMKKSISASLSIPVEVLDLTFGENYSASRASLVLFWNVVNQWRYNLESFLLNPIYSMWLQNEIELGRILAPGYNSDIVFKKAWENCRWVGIAKPSIDPFKEARAVETRLGSGLTTREIESQNYNGTSFEDNVSILTNENVALAEAIAPFSPATGGIET